MLSILIKFSRGKSIGNFIEIKLIFEFAAAVLTVDVFNTWIALGGCLVKFMNLFSNFIKDFINNLKYADWIVRRNL